jgi:hypothetical protein
VEIFFLIWLDFGANRNQTQKILMQHRKQEGSQAYNLQKRCKEKQLISFTRKISKN